MAGVDLMTGPAGLAAGAAGELAEHVARSRALGINVVSRRPLLRLQSELVLEGPDRLRPSPRDRPCLILRRGVRWHGNARHLPSVAVLQRARAHIGLDL